MADDDLTPAQRETMAQRIRDARPSWDKEGAFHRQPREVDRTNIKRWEDYKETVTFKSEEPAADVAPAQVPDDPVAAVDVDISFMLSFVQVNEDDTVRIKINYGEIGFVAPDGMTYGTDFTLDVADQGAEIWAEITYDPATLVQDGQTLEFGHPDYPSPGLPDALHVLTVDGGIIRWPIGFVNWDLDGDGHPTNVQAHNRWVGDINFQLIVGAHDAVPAVLPVIAGQWAAIPS